MAISKTYVTWEVVFSDGKTNMTFTFPRRTPGEAVTALWTELESMPSQADFLKRVIQIRVRKVEI